MSDKLEVMFDLQTHAQSNSFGGHPAQLDDDQKVTFIKDMILAAEDELHEALGEVGWKPWATARFLRRDAYIGELVDVMHFVVNLLLVAGCDAQEFYDRFTEKNIRNQARQAAGYDGIAGKCPVCKRALDDKEVLCSKLVGCVAAFPGKVDGPEFLGRAVPWPVTS